MIELRQLAIEFPRDVRGLGSAVRDVSLSIARGERVGIVGESGSGKSLTALACIGLVPEPGRIVRGAVLADGRDLMTAHADELRVWRGRRVGFCFQEASNALNPVYAVGFQLRESVCSHHGVGKSRGEEMARELLDLVSVGPVERIFGAYPHQLSGGQAQRVMLAIALAGDPDLLVADEPTSALDSVTTRAILCLLERLVREKGLALLLISHDLEIVRGAVDRTAVMYAGEIVEEAPTATLFREPLHPYTQLLLSSSPGAGGRPRHRAHLPDVHTPSADFESCSFAHRCPVARSQCRESRPQLTDVTIDRRLRCPISAEAWDGDRVEG